MRTKSRLILLTALFAITSGTARAGEVKGIGKGVKGAKQMYLELEQARKRGESYPTASTKGGKWFGSAANSETTVGEIRRGAHPRVRRYVFDQAGELTRIEVTTGDKTRVKSGESLATYLAETKAGNRAKEIKAPAHRAHRPGMAGRAR
jgi:hypothetical protein